MSERADTRGALSRWAPVVLVALAFVSPGAWLLTRLPPVPVAKALHLATAGVWLLAFGFGLVRLGGLDRRLRIGLGAVAGVVTVSFLLGGSHFAVAFYDLFANMPLVQWLAFVAVFVLAAGYSLGREELVRALAVATSIATVIAAVMIYQQVTTNANWVFGTTAYSITALVPFVPVAAGLAIASDGWWRWAWAGCGALIAVALAFFSASIMGTVAAAFAVVVTVALWPNPAASGPRIPRVVRTVAALLAALMVAGMLVAQVPALSGRWLGSETTTSPSLVSRIYLWEGAQRMVAERPLFGFGPSGYRVAAVEYLDPELFQFGPDVEGSIDPTVYSPQSPHSVFWEVFTRLGAAGLLAFAGLLVAWAAVLRERLKDPADPVGGLRAAVGAGFLAALFAMLTNPVLFSIGLFAPVAAGLAVAPPLSGRSGKAREAGARPRTAIALVGVVTLAVALWLFVGEWRGYTAVVSEPTSAIAAAESTLRILPGHPTTTRRLLEARLLTAADAEEVRRAQEAVDAAPGYVAAYAPNLVSLVAHSLAQAERTGRDDLAWEEETLSRAEAVLPPIPSLVAERLHLALLVGDAKMVSEALPHAQRWGAPYPLTEGYLLRAEAMRD